MTVNYSFDLEDDDFLDDTFRSIPESDLLSYNISSPSSENQLKNNEMRNIHAPSTSSSHEKSSVNSVCTYSNRKNSLSFLFKNRESTSTKLNEINISEIHSPNKPVNTDESTGINSRFIPGFTPKTKKRKLPGIVNFFSENDNLQPVDSKHLVTKGVTANIDIQNIANSQFSSEDLLLLSWQNLQADVSSRQNLLSMAKYYSIRRVLHETSKKKLPKHLVIPVLCVLIKKFNAEESSLIFMDDTGEISGKIDKEIFDIHKNAIQERTALILKKVTCICNILFLKKQNLVSIYLEDGSVKHVQDLNSMLDKEEPLKPMNCQCPGTPNEQSRVNIPHSKVCYNSTPISSKKVFDTNLDLTKKIMKPSYSSTKSAKENSCYINNNSSSECLQTPIGKEKVLNILETMLDVSKNDSNSENNMSLSSPNETDRENLKSLPKNAISSSPSCSTKVMKQNLTFKVLNKEKNYNYSDTKQKNNAGNKPLFVESSLEDDLFSEDTDDFDKILCSIDENSFLEKM